MYKFSSETTQLLQKSGWSEHRKVDTTKYKEFFEATGQPTSDLIFTFLESFGGLEVYTSDCTEAKLKTDDCDQLFLIDPLYHIKPNQYLSTYTPLIQKPIALVGTHGYSDLIAMSPEGEFFTIFDSYINRKGYTVNQTIESLCETHWYEVVRRPNRD